MNHAEPLTERERTSNYIAQNGVGADLTAAQRRRIRHKANEELREFPARPGRLRRRFDRRDVRAVKDAAAQMVGHIRLARERAGSKGILNTQGITPKGGFFRSRDRA